MSDQIEEGEAGLEEGVGVGGGEEVERKEEGEEGEEEEKRRGERGRGLRTRRYASGRF